MLEASKILHKGQPRIKVDFPYNQAFVELLRQVPDARWSQSHRAWHIPYTKLAFAKLKALFPDIIVDSPSQKQPETTEAFQEIKEKILEIAPDLPQTSSVLVEVIGRKIILKLPKNDTDTKFILSLRYSKWDKVQRLWVVPHYPGNLALIKEYFKERISNITIHESIEIQTSTQTLQVAEKEVLLIKTSSQRLRLVFGFNKALIVAIKKMPFWRWDNKNKWWTIPFSDKLLAEIQALAASEQLEVRYIEEPTEENKVARKTALEVLNYRPCPESMLLKLRELRYSEATIKAYKSLFEEFINHYPTTEIDKIDEPKIVAFCQYLVIDRKVSASTQNQAINAIKFYYERVLGGQRKLYVLERPKKEKILPTVLSEQEVVAILKACDNLKHKAILTLIYSAGLRISELINLKIKDIDSERKQIRIAQSKGKKTAIRCSLPKRWNCYVPTSRLTNPKNTSLKDKKEVNTPPEVYRLSLKMPVGEPE